MNNRGGFTIVETMVVLSVSSVLLISVMLFFGGRQARIEFNQGMRDIESYVRSVSNDVRNGYYPNPNQKCSVVSGEIIFDSNVTSSQGTSGSCVFVGKVMVFDSISEPSSINSYSIAGIKSASNPTGLKPTIMGASGNETLETYKIPAGIKVVNGSGAPIRAGLGVFFKLDGGSVNGSTSTTPYQIALSDTVNDLGGSVKKIFDTADPKGKELDSNGLKLCFAGGSTNQNGVVAIAKSIDGFTTSVLLNQNLGSVGCWDGDTL